MLELFSFQGGLIIAIFEPKLAFLEMVDLESSRLSQAAKHCRFFVKRTTCECEKAPSWVNNNRAKASTLFKRQWKASGYVSSEHIPPCLF